MNFTVGDRVQYRLSGLGLPMGTAVASRLHCYVCAVELARVRWDDGGEVEYDSRELRHAPNVRKEAPR